MANVRGMMGSQNQNLSVRLRTCVACFAVSRRKQEPRAVVTLLWRFARAAFLLLCSLAIPLSSHVARLLARWRHPYRGLWVERNMVYHTTIAFSSTKPHFNSQLKTIFSQIYNILERWATEFWARYFLKPMKWIFALKTADVEAVGRYDLPKVETLMWKANNYQAKMRTPRSCEYPPNLHPIIVMLISLVIRENMQTVRTLIASHKKRIYQNSLSSLFFSSHNLCFFSFCDGVYVCARTCMRVWMSRFVTSLAQLELPKSHSQEIFIFTSK